MFFRLCLVAFLSFGAAATAATPGGTLYDCDITQKKKRLFWISDKIAIVALKDGSVVVSDQVILHYNERPLTAKTTKNTDKTLSIRWTLKNLVNSANQRTSAFEYTATLDKARNKIKIQARPEGYVDRFYGRGTCRVRVE